MGVGYRKQPVKANITTPTRVIGTNYQNTTGRPILVICSCACIRGATANSRAIIYGAYGTVSPPTNYIAEAGLRTKTLDESINVCLCFPVPNEYYYKVASDIAGSGSVVLLDWVEVEL